MSRNTLGQQLVMIVDDDPAIRRSLKFSLELEGYTVETFQSAEALLADAWPARAACLVLDYRLPGLDGLQLLEALRRESVLCPAILMTSHPDLRLRQRAAAGRTPIVEKPLLGDALSIAITEALSHTPPFAPE